MQYHVILDRVITTPGCNVPTRHTCLTLKVLNKCGVIRDIFISIKKIFMALHWRHNDHSGVSNHQPHDCLLNRLFRRRSKKTSKLRVTVLCAGNSPGPVNSPHKGPVTRKMFPFDDVIMDICFCIVWSRIHCNNNASPLFYELGIKSN